jgi:hypothetical protein
MEQGATAHYGYRRSAVVPHGIAAGLFRFEYPKCPILLCFGIHFCQIIDILQVLGHLFPTKWCFSANNFVLLCPRNHAVAGFCWNGEANSRFVENKFLGHRDDQENFGFATKTDQREVAVF